MNAPDHSTPRSERDIFLEALEKRDADARAAFLDEACGKDLPLRRRLDNLLASHFAQDSLLAKPVRGRGSCRKRPFRIAVLRGSWDGLQRWLKMSYCGRARHSMRAACWPTAAVLIMTAVRTFIAIFIANSVEKSNEFAKDFAKVSDEDWDCSHTENCWAG